jgi:two-component system cell cycle sensor histidine kinase/response regulator CckA
MNRSMLDNNSILIVDDQPLNLRILSSLLTEEDYQVQTAQDGESALQMAHKSPPNLILLDVRLPDMDGYEVCKRLKEDESTRDIPIIFISAIGETHDKVLAFKAGGVDFMTKPLHIEEVLARVETHLVLRAVRGQLEAKNAQYEREIAERKRAEEELRESESRHRILSGLISDIAYSIHIEPDGTLTPEWVTGAIAPITGYTLDELLAKDDWQTLVHSDDIPAALEQLRDHLANQPAVAEYRIVTKDGETRWLRTYGHPVWSEEEDRVTGVIGATQDITERRHLERQMQQQERLAAVGQLAGGIAHDFNNLLTSIILYSQILQSKPHMPPDLVSHVETILDESRRAAELVQQILDYGRRSMIETQSIDLAPLTERLLDILRRTLPENIRLILDVNEGEYIVKADPTRIQQVLMNLATNARDAMPDGGELGIGLAHLSIRGQKDAPLAEMPIGEWVCMTVSDTGTGMSEEVQTHLFEPFFTTKPAGEGTGLGLAQVYGIVRQHEGYITVETRQAQGTTFSIYLPACTGAAQELPDRPPPSPIGKGEVILLAEDEKRLREVGAEILQSLGYQVLTAANGKQALAVYQSAESIDLIITDLVMPVMGGVELIQELLKTDPHVKALAITGYTLTVDKRELEDAGIVDVVTKPFDAATLGSTISRVLEKRR